MSPGRARLRPGLPRRSSEVETGNAQLKTHLRGPGRVLRSRSPDTVFGESFVIFGFGSETDGALQDVVSTEQLKSGFILEGEGDTYLHRLAFVALQESALSREESRTLIMKTADDLWAAGGRIE